MHPADSPAPPSPPADGPSLEAAILLIVIAVLQLALGLAQVAVLSGSEADEPTRTAMLRDVLQTFSLSTVFTMLAVWALFRPLVPAILGLLLFGGLTTWTLAGGVKVPPAFVVLWILVLLGLLRAVVRASLPPPNRSG